jgi:signal transduction histidine kinase
MASSAPPTGKRPPSSDDPRKRVRILRVLPPFADDAALQALLAETLAAVVALQRGSAGVLMLVDPGTGELYPAANLDLPEAYLDLVGRLPPGAGASGTALSTARSVVVQDTESDSLFVRHAAAAREAGFRATFSVPMRGRDGRVLGTLDTFFPKPHGPPEAERTQVELYARLAASAVDHALVQGRARAQGARSSEAEGEREHFEERERDAKRRSEFLAEASRLLGASLQYEPTLATVAAMALPFLGSWCFVDLVEPDDTMRRVAVIHPDPEKQRLARQLENGWPPERDDPLGAPRAVRTRSSEILPVVSDEVLVQAAHGEENLKILRALGIGSLIVAPMMTRDRVLGAITFVSADTGHQYSDDDVALAEEVASRSAVAIENARLLRAAEEANHAKSVFLSTMSHELRTPLNAIGGYAELLEMGVRGPLTEEQLEQVGRIRVNQRHLLGLVNEVLDFAKLDAGRMEYDIQPVAVSAAIRDMESVVAPLAEAKGVAFPREAGRGDLVVLADRERLVQILVNLFTNAVKFTDSGGRISLACDADGDRVLFRIADTGRGIPAESLDHIFDPFVQVSEGHTRTEEGTGLGLAISRNLARGMRGEITVESTLGRGSTFTVDLPRVEGDVDAARVAGSVVRDGAGVPVDRRSGNERRRGGDRRGDPPKGGTGG